MENRVQLNSPAAFLRWAGSKRQLVPKLKELYPAGARYVEPFAGSACLFFALSPPKAILGDINQELLHVLRTVRRTPEQVGAKLSRMSRSKQKYLQLRSIDPDSLSNIERTVRFVYLNRYCFNGLYRTNAQGQFNVPFGASGTGKLPTRDGLIACARSLRRARLIHGDFEKVLRYVCAGDFVYMDPPYAVRSRRIFGEYHPDSFSDRDITRLREWMVRLNRIGATFVVSYAQSAESELLSEGFTTQLVNVKRNIAGFTSNRSRCKEVLITNQ